jgi:ATP synthase protein I
MTTERDDRPTEQGSRPELGELSARLKDLSGRIAAERSEQAENDRPHAGMVGAAGYAKGYRLASEFVAGTLVGGLIGYGIDWLLGTSPFGLIIFLLLGFGAGILNMARSANRTPPAKERLEPNPPSRTVIEGKEED